MFQTAMPRGRNDSSSSYDTLESQTEDGFSSQGDEVDHEGANQANSRVTDFNARQRRIDQKQVTLELDKSSKDLYFSKLIKDGEISKEGRDALRDKYYLSPKMYEAWQPPQLEDTKLYFLAPKKNRDSVDAGLLSIHGRIREAAKIGLATLEHLASAEDLDNIALTADDLRDTQVCQRSKITLSNISRRWEL